MREIGGWIHIITRPSGLVIICIHTPIPDLCNAIQITGLMFSRFYIITSDVNLRTNILVWNSFITSYWYLTACCWLCTTMVALVIWITCARSSCTCCHLHCYEVFKMREQYHAQLKMKSWTVIRVIMWLLCEHGIEASKEWVFVAHFIHLFNTMILMLCTNIRSKAPMSHFLNRRVVMG